MGLNSWALWGFVDVILLSTSLIPTLIYTLTLLFISQFLKKKKKKPLSTQLPQVKIPEETGVLPSSPIGPQIHPYLPSVLIFLFSTGITLSRPVVLNQDQSGSFFFLFSKCICFNSPSPGFLRGYFKNLTRVGCILLQTNFHIHWVPLDLTFIISYLEYLTPWSACLWSLHTLSEWSASKSNLIIFFLLLKNLQWLKW